jgi:hypothetical protein
MKKVYIAGKLNDNAVNYIKNMHAMITIADKIRRLGYSVFIPCLDILSGLVAGNFEYQDYFQNNLPWLEAADAVFVCPGYETSKGTLEEIKHAERLGKPVYFKYTELLNS